MSEDVELRAYVCPECVRKYRDARQLVVPLMLYPTKETHCRLAGELVNVRFGDGVERPSEIDADYRALLTRYIAHVREYEGVDFIDQWCPGTPLSKSDISELLRLRVENESDDGPDQKNS